MCTPKPKGMWGSLSPMSLLMDGKQTHRGELTGSRSWGSVARAGVWSLSPSPGSSVPPGDTESFTLFSLSIPQHFSAPHCSLHFLISSIQFSKYFFVTYYILGCKDIGATFIKSSLPDIMKDTEVSIELCSRLDPQTHMSKLRPERLWGSDSPGAMSTPGPRKHHPSIKGPGALEKGLSPGWRGKTGWIWPILPWQQVGRYSEKDGSSLKTQEPTWRRSQWPKLKRHGQQ